MDGIESTTGAFAIKNKINFTMHYHKPGYFSNTDNYYPASRDTFTYYVYDIVDNKTSYAIDSGTDNRIIGQDIIDYNEYTQARQKKIDGSTVISASEIVFKLTDIPSGGVLKKNGSTLSVNATFTQDDINNESNSV